MSYDYKKGIVIVLMILALVGIAFAQGAKFAYNKANTQANEFLKENCVFKFENEKQPNFSINLTLLEKATLK